jgi:hypothetical protein
MGDFIGERHHSQVATVQLIDARPKTDVDLAPAARSELTIRSRECTSPW